MVFGNNRQAKILDEMEKTSYNINIPFKCDYKNVRIQKTVNGIQKNFYLIFKVKEKFIYINKGYFFSRRYSKCSLDKLECDPN